MNTLWAVPYNAANGMGSSTCAPMQGQMGAQGPAANCAPYEPWLAPSSMKAYGNASNAGGYNMGFGMGGASSGSNFMPRAAPAGNGWVGPNTSDPSCGSSAGACGSMSQMAVGHHQGNHHQNQGAWMGPTACAGQGMEGGMSTVPYGCDAQEAGMGHYGGHYSSGSRMDFSSGRMGTGMGCSGGTVMPPPSQPPRMQPSLQQLLQSPQQHPPQQPPQQQQQQQRQQQQPTPLALDASLPRAPAPLRQAPIGLSFAELESKLSQSFQVWAKDNPADDVEETITPATTAGRSSSVLSLLQATSSASLEGPGDGEQESVGNEAPEDGEQESVADEAGDSSSAVYDVENSAGAGLTPADLLAAARLAASVPWPERRVMHGDGLFCPCCAARSTCPFHEERLATEVFAVSSDKAFDSAAKRRGQKLGAQVIDDHIPGEETSTEAGSSEVNCGGGSDEWSDIGECTSGVSNSVSMPPFAAQHRRDAAPSNVSQPRQRNSRGAGLPRSGVNPPSPPRRGKSLSIGGSLAHQVESPAHKATAASRGRRSTGTIAGRR